MIGLSTVIPVYKGANSIGPLVKELSKLEIENGFEIILVNDGSPDNSYQIIKSLVEETTLPIISIDLARNFGEHNAVMAGLSVADGDYIINIDDDFQNPPSEVKKLYDYARVNSDLDVIYTFYAKKKHSFFRNLGSKFTNWAANFLLDKPKNLYLSSFRCINRFTKDNIVSYVGPYPYMDGLILQTTQKIGSLLVEHKSRLGGESNYTFRRLIRLWTAMFVNFSVMPLRISSLFGITTCFLGFIMALVTVIERFTGDTPVGWTSLMAGLLIFSGVQLLILGMIGEYLGRLFLTVNGRPQFVIREIKQSKKKTKYKK
ncbi:MULTISPECIES: glycosyltransferase family 2 protein [Leptospira]|uniref:glycosyltransferase family 2 protein n=1 Tax=Leptospira TaxID=171 RepID=UPI00022F8967|nr:MULTISPECIES: glycosyltransferase family 2 protein [Leptospira]AER02089.1 glycosyl transferase [Leptospira interrogans serovar Lai str. IPAV]SIQ12497.1 undecaprenyl-phosphate 4-deoxy-4-formamido-L-arabinose transferase [Leptospira interrogans]